MIVFEILIELALIALLICEPLWFFALAMAIGIPATVLFWYYIHTWPLHAWDDGPHAFSRFLWRRITSRE